MDAGIFVKPESVLEFTRVKKEAYSGTKDVQEAVSVIQQYQQTVIQAPTNIQPAQLQKESVILVSKPNTVIQSLPEGLQTLQEVETGSNDLLAIEDDSNRKRKDGLSRRLLYRDILHELDGGDIEAIPVTIEIMGQGEVVEGFHTLTMANASSGGAFVQYDSQGQDKQFFVPIVTQEVGVGSEPSVAEEQARRREMRLLKNKEAAKECRRRRKKYIMCLENRAAVLENQNKALIDELKSLKELYCQQNEEGDIS